MTDWRWQDDAACIGTDPDAFFPESHEYRRGLTAKAICAGCPVAIQCLEHALVNHEYVGIWGNTNERERAVLRRVKAAS